MKQSFFLIASILVFLTACNDKKEYTISGTVNNPDLNGKYVYLSEYGSTDMPIDSALVENGKFTFKGQQEEPMLSVLQFDPFVLPPIRPKAGEISPFSTVFVLENAPLTVSLDRVSTVNGTSENDSFSNLITTIANKRDELTPYMEDLKSTDADVQGAAREKYSEIEKSITESAKSYIFRNTDKQTAAKLLYDFRHSLSEDERREVIEKASNEFLAVPNTEKLVEHLNTLSKVAVGNKFTDFEMPTPSGDNKKVSDYVANNELLLVDFWASWCGPCRAIMPELKEIYAKYHNSGLEILGVSLDSSKEAWENGIKTLGLPWAQISDLKGWQSGGAALYGVNSIPHLVLIDKNGTIVAKNLHGENLENKIRELLNER